MQLLGGMGYQNVVIGALIPGAGKVWNRSTGDFSFVSPNLAFVVAYGEFQGKRTEIQETFFYSREDGWYCMEIAEDRGVVRLWNAQGYRELTAAQAAPTP